MVDPLFIAIIVLAALLTGLSKSGLVVSLGAVSAPLMTLVMSARDAAGVLLPVLLALDAIALLVYRREVDWRIFRIMIPGALVGTGIGWALSAVVSEPVVRLAIGVITLVFVLDAWFPLRKRLEGLPPSRIWGAFWGGVAGFTSFISHTGGPPFQIYVMPQKLAPAVFSGTTAFFFASVNAAKLVPYGFLGQLSAHNLTLSAALVPVAVGAMLVGVMLVRRVSTGVYYRLTYWLLFLLALKLIHDGVLALVLAQ